MIIKELVDYLYSKQWAGRMAAKLAPVCNLESPLTAVNILVISHYLPKLQKLLVDHGITENNFPSILQFIKGLLRGDSTRGLQELATPSKDAAREVPSTTVSDRAEKGATDILLTREAHSPSRGGEQEANPKAEAELGKDVSAYGASDFADEDFFGKILRVTEKFFTEMEECRKQREEARQQREEARQESERFRTEFLEGVERHIALLSNMEAAIRTERESLDANPEGLGWGGAMLEPGQGIYGKHEQPTVNLGKDEWQEVD